MHRRALPTTKRKCRRITVIFDLCFDLGSWIGPFVLRASTVGPGNPISDGLCSKEYSPQRQRGTFFSRRTCSGSSCIGAYRPKEATPQGARSSGRYGARLATPVGKAHPSFWLVRWLRFPNDSRSALGRRFRARTFVASPWNGGAIGCLAPGQTTGRCRHAGNGPRHARQTDGRLLASRKG
jgi:hypothetical protein